MWGIYASVEVTLGDLWQCSAFVTLWLPLSHSKGLWGSCPQGW